MKNNYYCRAWYKGKKRKALEQAVSLLKQFDWCDCNELSQDKGNVFHISQHRLLFLRQSAGELGNLQCCNQ